jgi:dimethylamine/trimethylamine dehydrogenase
VTPEARVSQWAENTMEQRRIQQRLLEAGVDVRTTTTLVSAGGGRVRTACAYTGREGEIACDALVLVTARLPVDGLAEELSAGDGTAVRAIGDAWSPGTIAAAVWEGRRYAEDLDDPRPADGDSVPFRREVVALAPAADRAAGAA